MEDVTASGNSYGSWKDSLETQSVRDYHAKLDSPMNFQYQCNIHRSRSMFFPELKKEILKHMIFE